jgi:lysophospholipase L1-like esterase
VRHADWFRQVWNDRHAAWARHIEDDRGAVVFVGDSITQNWGDTLGDSFPGWRVANRGIGGDTTRGVLFRLGHDVLRLHPRAVVILAGTNDLEEGADTATIAGNMRMILQSLEASDRALPIFLCEVFPSSASVKRPKARVLELNQRYRDLAKSDGRVTLVPTWAVFADDNGDARASEFPDLLHPNALGYARWAQLLRPMLARAVPPSQEKAP